MLHSFSLIKDIQKISKTVSISRPDKRMDLSPQSEIRTTFSEDFFLSPIGLPSVQIDSRRLG
jgi:UDP-3-O-acyl-N-acetylglucosamine deacetylase